MNHDNMLSQLALLTIAIIIPLTHAAETILGLYIFSRHGDRTSKATPPTLLTDFGYSEVFSSGTWFRNHYIANGSTSQIYGVAPDLVKQSQIAASAPLDNVLMPSCLGFLQGLYPPAGDTLGSQTLANGTVVKSPLNGYQIVPVSTVTSGTGSEDSAWLQGAGNCAKAIVSSNNYFSSQEYMDLLNTTKSFYQSLNPVVNSTFTADQNTFKNAYSIFDYLNVASIHNRTIPSSILLTPSTLQTLGSLANVHEFALAYNVSEPIRAISGATLAAQVLAALNATIATQAKQTPLITIQFGAYNAFQSFFGLANLTAQRGGVDDFMGIPDYASSMTFELFTTAAPVPFPGPEQLSVRFLFHNGTTGNDSTPTPYPLFGGQDTTIPWADFVKGMQTFAVGSQTTWCQACGNSTGVCAAVDTGTGGSAAGAASTGNAAGEGGSGNGNGLSPAVNGVIGAMVTLAVVLGVEALVVLVAGLRVVKKRVGGKEEAGVGPEAVGKNGAA